MKTPLLAANWKMHKTTEEARAFCRDLRAALDEAALGHLLIAPPYTALVAVLEAMEGFGHVAAQNCHWEDHGAFTGEISPVMLKDLGVDAVIIGHSERRHLFGESQAMVTKRLIGALSHGLTVIYCIGETLEEREAGNALKTIEGHLAPLADLKEGADRLILAYEPVWAIGTGKVATPEQVDEIHNAIRKRHPGLPILYGGSVKPGNVESLISLPAVDGALIGGAGLVADSFAEIIHRSLKIKGV